MAGAATERVLHKLTGVKPIANGWVARCPGHDDKHQSLQISERPDASVGLHCHAGCQKTDLLSAMGLTFADLFAPKADPPGKKQLVKTYDYRALDGTLLYQGCRYSPKEFKQRRPDGNGGWKWDMAPLQKRHVPYRLPELAGHQLVVCCEGEKDADRVWALGLPATTNIGGAGKWGPGETKGLKLAGVSRVIVLPDNDEAGHKHAAVVAASVKAAGLAVSVIELPDLPEKGDVSTWLDAGHTRADLEALINGTPYLVPAAAPAVAPAVTTPAPVLPIDSIDPTQYHETDLGAALALRDRYGDRLRFDHQRDQWLVWDGHFWRPDLDEGAFRLAHEHIRRLQEEALAIPDYTQRKKYLDFALAREKRGALVSMMQQSRSLEPIAISGDAWDADGWVLGCPNGIVDLKTGMLRPGARNDFVTLQTGTAFDMAASCPRWELFLEEVFDGNLELITFIHRAIGYSLTADMREQCFFVAYGSGSNGKSIFIDAMETVFGSYGHRADMRMFAGFTADSNSFQNADFRGKRLIFAAEVRPNSRMNEHVLKHFTGGETLRAEFKYGRSFTIRPVGKIWLGVNHRPKVADDSFGFWRRVRLIPFLRTFTGTGEDRTLRERLRAEAPGILAWAVRGCLAWQVHGLVPPAIVQEATDTYQAGEDPLAEFFDACLVCTEATAMSITPFAKLYGAYRDWATANGIADREKLTSKALGNLMQRRPFERVKVSNTVCYKGFEVRKANLFDGS